MAPAISTPSKPKTLEQRLHMVREPAVLLSCEQSFKKLTVVNDMTLAQAFRQSWTCRPLSKKTPPQVAVCHVRGVIKKVYTDLHWYPAVMDTVYQLGRSVGYIEEVVQREGHALQETLVRDLLERVKCSAIATGSSYPDLWNFTGNEAKEYNHLVGMDLSAQLTQRGMANPVRYLNCD